MKFRRKIYAVLMTAVMILTLLPAMAFAEGETTAKPVEATFSGVPWGYPNNTELFGIFEEGNSIYVTYDDSSEKVFSYGTYEYVDEDGETQNIDGFLEETGEGEHADPGQFINYAFINVDYERFDHLVEGANEVPMVISVPNGTDEYGYINYEDFDITLHIWVKLDRPVKVTFVPADGFTVKGNIGYNYFDEEAFYGEGNKFEVEVEYKDDPETTIPPIGSYTAEYEYYKSEDGSVEGFFDHGNPEYERFNMYEDNLECYLNSGLNKDVEFKHYAYFEGQEDPEELTFKVDVEADKYGLYADGFTSTYTGNVIKPKFRIYNTDDEVVPTREYTYTAPKNKKIGRYNLTVRIKDAYKDKYDVDKIVVTYGIGPKAPVLSKVTAGKQSLTVSWKKMTAAQLKNIDGFYIMLSTDKQFLNNRKKVYVNKKAFKAGKKVFKKLKKGKRYYVKMYSYKTVKQRGVTFKMPSNDSKILYRTTK